MKRIISFLYIAIIIVLAAATFIEHSEGREYALTNIYGAWWFSLLWALLVAFGIAWILKRKVKRWATLLLHVSLIIILLGALLTRYFSHQGIIHLRIGETTNQYYGQPTENGMKVESLPFSVKLNQFEVTYHEGTEAANNYISHITITDGEKQVNGIVSMNNIYSYKGIRMYQNAFDDDRRGSILSINDDPWGIPVTYLGYGLLFFSLIWLLIDPNGTFRRLLKSPLLKRATVLVPILFIVTILQAQPTVSKDIAKEFGQLNILHNDRICPMQTFAIDFTKKMYGKAHYKEFSAEQVLLGFIFWGDEWSKEPIIKVKGGEIKSKFGISKYASVNTFFEAYTGNYKLGPYLQEFYNGNHDNLHKQAQQLDDKLMLVMELRRGTLLKMFPNTHNGITTWISPTQKLPEGVSTDNASFISSVFDQLYQDTQTKDMAHFQSIVSEIKSFQLKNGGSSIPTNTKTQAEYIYNKVSFATILFMVNLTMGILSLIYLIYRMTRKNPATTKKDKLFKTLQISIMTLSFIALTTCIILRWIIKSSLPMSNGYETMLFIAWFVMFTSLIVNMKFRNIAETLSSLFITSCFLSSGFFLLVSHINQMDPQITHLMPVLNSPLLSLHVSVIMMSYALLSLTFICGIMGLIMKKSAEQLAILSKIMLYPAITTMGLGVFIGAIWANVSWGQYWNWDPKETWALITFMVYAIAVHTQSLPIFNRPRVFHAFMVFAFLTILMTYFGVNYVLGGMHSYA